MVRLGEISHLPNRIQLQCFNSTMVRLGDFMPFRFINALAVSIPLWSDWEFIFFSLSAANSFVSIPLWSDWEPIETKEDSWLSLEFQFHYGPIGRMAKVILVIAKLRFQFHYGPIGRSTIRNGRNSPPVSIPLWSDWEFCTNSSVIFPVWFQFHYGPIGSRTNTCNNPINSLVSIPLWSDWEFHVCITLS